MHRVALAGLALAVIAALAAIGAGLGYRLELWSHRPAFTILRWAAYGGLAAAALSVAGTILVARRRARSALAAGLTGLALGLLVAGVPLAELRAARSVPAIHDISTDLQDPPAFVAMLPLRAGAPNSPHYGGPEVAALQREAYPDIRGIILPMPPADAFEKAVATARALGWELVAAVPGEGRMEATDRTFWFGFRDDVVVRVRPAAGGSRIDLRSVSRVGRSDVGANAKRIRRFIAALQ